jgi:hypothetical protein
MELLEVAGLELLELALLVALEIHPARFRHKVMLAVMPKALLAAEAVVLLIQAQVLSLNTLAQTAELELLLT